MDEKGKGHAVLAATLVATKERALEAKRHWIVAFAGVTSR